MPSDPLNWHRYFGLFLTDFFIGSPFVVELEKDLSVKKQLLDVVIIRKEEGPFHGRLPDGFDNLDRHNLITFKSHQETLDDWALKELIGHYVNYRKQISPTMQDLLPEEQFRLYAVSAHFPQKLAKQVGFTLIQPGVYECRWGTDAVRIVVMRQLPQNENNALLHLFSASVDLVRFGGEHYRMHSKETSTLVQRLFVSYSLEGIKMPYTMADFRRQSARRRSRASLPRKFSNFVPPKNSLNFCPPKSVSRGCSPKSFSRGCHPKSVLRECHPKSDSRECHPKSDSRECHPKNVSKIFLPKMSSRYFHWKTF